MTETRWSPDLDIAVHDDQLIVHFDHLPPAEMDREPDGLVLHDRGGLHCFRVQLPEGLDLERGVLETRASDGDQELRLRVPD